MCERGKERRVSTCECVCVCVWEGEGEGEGEGSATLDTFLTQHNVLHAHLAVRMHVCVCSDLVLNHLLPVPSQSTEDERKVSDGHVLW